MLYLQGGIFLAHKEWKRPEDLLQGSNIKLEGPIEDSGGWSRFTYRSERPLKREKDLPASGYYQYAVLARLGVGKIALLSEGNNIVRLILKREIIKESAFRTKQVRMDVARLVDDICEAPGEYALNRVDAMVVSFGQALRVVSFYGEDVGEARLFRDNRQHLQCYGCGLRRSGGKGDVCRLTARGVISFRYDSRASLIAVNQALHYLSANNYIAE